MGDNVKKLLREKMDLLVENDRVQEACAIRLASSLS
jgi:hypothetical protein